MADQMDGKSRCSLAQLADWGIQRRFSNVPDLSRIPDWLLQNILLIPSIPMPFLCFQSPDNPLQPSNWATQLYFVSRCGAGGGVPSGSLTSPAHKVTETHDGQT